MGKFTIIPKDTFDALQMDAGVLLRKFDPTKPEETTADDVITATTGGINAVCQPTYSDLGEDVDNCPVNMMELKHLDSWACTFAGTALGTSPEAIRLALGAADIDEETGKITPRRDLKQSDFTDEIWWVGDKADGGFVAACLKHALSTDGFSLQTTKSGKGQTSFTLTGHVSINAQDEVPMTFYSISPKSTDTPASGDETKADTGDSSQTGGKSTGGSSDAGSTTGSDTGSDSNKSGTESQTGSDTDKSGTESQNTTSSGAKKNTLK